jgi:hypothetical protein
MIKVKSRLEILGTKMSLFLKEPLHEMLHGYDVRGRVLLAPPIQVEGGERRVPAVYFDKHTNSPIAKVFSFACGYTHEEVMSALSQAAHWVNHYRNDKVLLQDDVERLLTAASLEANRSAVFREMAGDCTVKLREKINQLYRAPVPEDVAASVPLMEWPENWGE